MQAKEGWLFLEKKPLIVMTKFPDIGQIAKIPWHFFPDLEKILFFPDTW